MSGDKMTEG
jgi:hypothetical protein